jgi:hypothetical protein
VRFSRPRSTPDLIVATAPPGLRWPPPAGPSPRKTFRPGNPRPAAPGTGNRSRPNRETGVPSGCFPIPAGEAPFPDSGRIGNRGPEIPTKPGNGGSDSRFLFMEAFLSIEHPLRTPPPDKPWARPTRTRVRTVDSRFPSHGDVRASTAVDSEYTQPRVSCH